MLQDTTKCAAGEIPMCSLCQAPSGNSDQGLSLILGEDGRGMGWEVAAPRSQQVFCERDGKEEIASVTSRPKAKWQLEWDFAANKSACGCEQIVSSRMTGMPMSGASRESGALPQPQHFWERAALPRLLDPSGWGVCAAAGGQQGLWITLLHCP